MTESNWNLLGLLAGVAFIAIGAGMQWVYRQVYFCKPATDATPPPEALISILTKFTRAAQICFVLGIVLISAALILGPGLGHSPENTQIPISLYYAAALALLLGVLSYNVMRHRVRALLSNFGKEDPTSERITRVHANFAEYVPTGLALLLALEWTGAPALLVHFGGATFTLGRYLHAWGFTHSDGASFGRIVGIQTSLFALAYMVAASLYYLCCA